jgi:hypothetical protein
MSEALGVQLILAGVFLIAVGQIWLIIRGFRISFAWGVANWAAVGDLVFPFYHWRLARLPLALIVSGFLLGALPLAITQLTPVDLGPLNRDVNGERHLTLTGWDRSDYSLLSHFPDTVLLQMANPDVTDATLIHLQSLSKLRELDLTNTQVTDAGLPSLTRLPALTTLRLRNCHITDTGFREHLLPIPTLTQLDLRGTKVSPETVAEWRQAKPNRKAMANPPAPAQPLPSPPPTP